MAAMTGVTGVTGVRGDVTRELRDGWRDVLGVRDRAGTIEEEGGGAVGKVGGDNRIRCDEEEVALKT